MTEQPSSQPDATSERYPLSFTQGYFRSLDEGDLKGAFGIRFTIVAALRIAGHVDVAALQGALDDLVLRHELLRTIVARDAHPPYQQVHPPCGVPLEVRDLPPVIDRSRGLVAEELIIEAERRTMSPRQVPVLRAVLGRFDDSDSVLVLLEHHSASDGWSMNVIMRDLAAFYAARTSHRPADLPAVRQYREFAAWQRVGSAAMSEARQYWRDKLRGAHVLALPKDRPAPEVYSRPFSGHSYVVSADEMAVAAKFAAEMRSSMFMVLMAVASVFCYEVTGRADPAIRSFTTGRDEPAFHNTIGPFMNVVPFRTDISRCASFREIVASTRDTCIEAYAHEIPLTLLEQDLPEFNLPHDEPKNSPFVLGMVQSPHEAAALPIADGAYPILKRTLPSSETSDIPNGLLWTMDIASSGALSGNVVYNLDEFDEQRVTGWISDYHRILSRLASEPDREWRQLTTVAT